MMRQSFAVGAYSLAMGAVIYLSCWVNNWAQLLPSVAALFPLSIDGEPFVNLHLPNAVYAAAFNVCLMVLFAVQHNIMARLKVKAHMRKVVHFSWERSLFVFSAGILLAFIVHMWQPIPSIIWRVPAPYDKLVVGLGLLAYVLFFCSTFAIDHFDLFGLRQAFSGHCEKTYPGVPFKMNVFYAFVRHPLYLGMLTFFFCAPVMSAGRLLFSCANLAFVLWSLPLEEGDLETLMGEDYARYRKSVPALIPALKAYNHKAMIRKTL